MIEQSGREIKCRSTVAVNIHSVQFKKGSETQKQINEVSKWTAAELNYHPDRVKVPLVQQ